MRYGVSMLQVVRVHPEPVEGCAGAMPTKNGLSSRLDPWIPAFAGKTGEAIRPF